MLKSEFVKKLNGFLFEVLKASKPTPAKRLEMIKSLVGYGADVNAKFNGKSVLSLAVDLNETDLILYLKSQGARYGKNLEKQLVEVIWDKEVSQSVCLEKMKYLIYLGANVNKRNKDGDTVLMEAVKRGNAEIVKFLIENGANVNQKNKEGETALMVASEKGKADIVKLLIENKADVHQKNNDNWNALLVACAEGHFEIVDMLVQNGAESGIEAEVEDDNIDYDNIDNVIEILEKEFRPEDQWDTEGDDMVCDVNDKKPKILKKEIKQVNNQKNGGFLSKIFGCKGR